MDREARESYVKRQMAHGLANAIMLKEPMALSGWDTVHNPYGRNGDGLTEVELRQTVTIIGVPDG